MEKKNLKEENNITEQLLHLPMLALRGLVLFPAMVIHFDVGREKSIKAINEAMNHDQKIFLTAQKDILTEEPKENDLFSVGIVAHIRQVLKLPENNLRILVEGMFRGKLIHLTKNTPFLRAQVLPMPIEPPAAKPSAMDGALMRCLKDLFEQYCMLSPKISKDIIASILATEDPVFLGEYIASNLMLRYQDKQKILQQNNYKKRLQMLIQILKNENNILALERKIEDKVKDQMDDNQREYYLREQLKAITDELGEGESIENEVTQYREQIFSLGLESQWEEKLLQETDRLYKLPSGSHEAGVIRGYLDTTLALPWNKSTADRLDIAKAQKVLDKDHYGLTEVKQRILETIAVKKLAPSSQGQIICLYGPPGVGKTSIAKSLAKAMGKKYVRISLGGIKDESEIRGHRKTYIGSMPGRIIDAVKTAETKNPLILLDEIDKMSNDFRGDPSSAMLEVLDSEQNKNFRDHFIEIPFDLSGVTFITTANDLEPIPAPLLDRMDVITLSSYSREEKFHIAKEHLIPKQLKKHGLNGKIIVIKDSAIYALIDFYTREAGVRKLERSISSICRKVAKNYVAGETKRTTVDEKALQKLLGNKKYKPQLIAENDQIGVVTGLAWTSVGGETMDIEVSALKGDGKIQLTGSLGDVMQESAKTAISYVRSIADEYGIEADFYKKYDIHIHAPEGAVPKDGPSAGITMATAIVSELTNIPVKRDVAMTGEISLKGKVLPIGGLKEKTMAAYRAGVKVIVIPAENEPDLSEVAQCVKDAVDFVLAKDVKTVLKTALLKAPKPRKAAAEENLPPKKPIASVDGGAYTN